MPVIQTSSLSPDVSLLPTISHQVYCGLDNAVMLEIQSELHRLRNRPPPIYNFSRALQAPYLEIMNRGFRIDELSRNRACQELRERRDNLRNLLDKLAFSVWDRSLNPRSTQQLAAFFYGAMKLPEVWIRQKGESHLSTNREALEKLDVYLHARPFISLILSIRDISKQLEVLETQIDSDGRFRSSYNIAGTECIAGDSLIWTKSGLRTIEEIYSSPYPCAVWNGNTFINPVRKVKFPARSGRHIILENGYEIKCSDNHMLLTSIGWQRADQLKIEQSMIQINCGIPKLFGQYAVPRGSLIDLMSEDFCEFVGMWLADGSLNCNSDHYRCRLSNSDEEVRQRFIQLSYSVFKVEAKIYRDETVFSSKEVCTWLRDIGLSADSGLGTATIKKIPSLLLRGTPNLLRALIRGITLDSHQTDKGIMFGTQSQILRDQIQQILLILGIKSTKISTGNSIKLNVPRSYCSRFLGVIGFVQARKAVKLALFLNQRSQWHETIPFGDKPFIPVISIRDWTGDVFDLTMPESSPPQYIAQGMTVHNTGRPSSSQSAFGTGSNAQNIAPSLRYVFVADPGMKMGQIDLEQVEARDVGWICGVLFGDWSFLDSCEGGDLHTRNSMLVWPELPWTSDPKHNRQIADRIFYRDFSYRDMSKRGGHLSNYHGTAWTMSRSLKIPIEVAEEFQARYIKGRVASAKHPTAIEPAYPCIAQYWQWIAEQIQTTYSLTTPFGRQRHFFGRPGDDSTLREAIAFLPQSTTADRMNLGLWRVWKYLPQVQLLAQTYDSITFQYDEKDEDDIIQAALKLIEVNLEAPGRPRYVVPGEAKVGWNWGYQVTQDQVDKARSAGKKPPRLNLDGLAKWKPGGDGRVRHTGLQRIMQ